MLIEFFPKKIKAANMDFFLPLQISYGDLNFCMIYFTLGFGRYIVQQTC